ncbi:MAG: GyrI-like domain-containing protein [Phycisphaerae bacterium]
MQSETHETYQRRVLRVLVYIQSHLDEALDLQALARVAHFSPYHFHRIFRGLVGEAVKQHIRRLRLERAAYRLKFTEQPVTRIAFEAGYETHEAFSRRFREMFDASPSKFRQAHRALHYPAAATGVHYTPDGAVQEFHAIETGAEAMEVRIEMLEPMRVAFFRHLGPYDQVGGTWMKLMNWAGGRGLMGPETVTFGICHDDPEVTPPEKIRYDACIRVGREVEAEADLAIQEILGGRYAVARHQGPYATLGDTYLRMFGQELASRKYEARSAPCLEFYLNSPMNTAPEDLLTDVYVPVEG